MRRGTRTLSSGQHEVGDDKRGRVLQRNRERLPPVRSGAYLKAFVLNRVSDEGANRGLVFYYQDVRQSSPAPTD